jgi:hypothetical protein
MNNRLKHNLITLSIYSVFVYLLLTPFKMFWEMIPVSILIGFFFGMLNDIIIQLRKLNGEKFNNLED